MPVCISKSVLSVFFRNFIIFPVFVFENLLHQAIDSLHSSCCAQKKENNSNKGCPKLTVKPNSQRSSHTDCHNHNQAHLCNHAQYLNCFFPVIAVLFHEYDYIQFTVKCLGFH